jgi:hypothetical protein
MLASVAIGLAYRIRHSPRLTKGVCIVTLLKIVFPAALLSLVCSAAAQAQTATDSTATPSGAQPQAQKVPVMVTWNYYPQPKSLVLHLVNNSGKDITAYDVTVKNKYIDGKQDDPCCLQHTYNMLNRWVEIQTAKDPAAAERRDRETNGIFAAGTTRDIILQESKDVSDVEAVVDVAFYTDATFDEQNTDTFKVMLAARQRRLLTIKKVNSAIENALANQADDHPGGAALTELTKFAIDAATKNTVYQKGQQYDPEVGQQFPLQMDIQNLQFNLQREQKATTERDRLIEYGEYIKKEIEVLTPHCHLEITPSQYAK